MVKRSELLGLITQDRFCIAIAGTHGKTTVSTMVTHLLNKSGANVGAFLGGISRNLNSNLLLPKSKNSMVVCEADEFDRSFLQLYPSISVVTSLDPDHLDIYGTYENVREAFAQFVCNTVPEGKFLYNKKVALLQHIPCTVNAYSYSVSDEDADYYTKNIRIVDGNFVFDFYAPHMIIRDVRMGYPGRANLENMVAAMAVAMMAGADPIEIQKAIATFKGVVRRFDIRYKDKDVMYIDDYAHHPRELEATIKSVREIYPDKKITGVFQPHLYSRTRDFADGFAKSLDLLNEAFLLPIYPARELPIPGVTSDIIFEKMNNVNKTQCTIPQLIKLLEQHETQILITLGAGNIDTLASPIVEMLTKKYQTA